MKIKQITIAITFLITAAFCNAAEPTRSELTQNTTITENKNGSTTRTTIYSRGESTILKKSEIIPKGAVKPAVVLYTPLLAGKKLLTSTSHEGKRSLILSSEIPATIEVLISPSDSGEHIIVQKTVGSFEILEVFNFKADGTIQPFKTAELEAMTHSIYAENSHPLANN